MARTVRNLPEERLCKTTKESDSHTEQKQKCYRSALYVRLSIEDSGKEESNVLENQISLLKEYVKQNPSLQVCEIYQDNGWSGTNFNRPAFDRMMEDIKQRKIDCVIVKDLSRLGRNYLETGQYVETILPFFGVRFIAVNDHFDTLISGSMENGLLMPFKNLVNEAYAKDISRKVSTALTMKMEKGEFGGGFVPYGYQKNKDGTGLLVDPKTVETVKRIFQLRLEGKSYHAIARRLNDDGILSPSAYRYQKGEVKSERYQGVLWKRHVLTDLLSNPVYLGWMVRGKSKSTLYQGIGLHCVQPDEWKVFKGTHEAIIEEEVFEQVQQITEQRKQEHLQRLGKYNHLGKEENLFGKKAVCGDCGSILSLYRSVVRGKDVYYNFICPNYEENRHRVCSRKNIRKKVLEEVVFTVVQQYMELFLDAKERIWEKNKEAGNVRIRKDLERQLENHEKRSRQIDSLSVNLYRDYKEGILTEDEYFYAKKSYQKEQTQLFEKIQIIKKEIENYSSCYMEDENLNGAVTVWKQEEKEMDQGTLTKEMVEHFIEKVYVYEDDRVEVTLKYEDEFQKLFHILREREGLLNGR